MCDENNFGNAYFKYHLVLFIILHVLNIIESDASNNGNSTESKIYLFQISISLQNSFAKTFSVAWCMIKKKLFCIANLPLYIKKYPTFMPRDDKKIRYTRLYEKMVDSVEANKVKERIYS